MNSIALQKADISNKQDFERVYRAMRMAALVSHVKPATRKYLRDELEDGRSDPYLIMNGPTILGAAIMSAPKYDPYLYDFAIYRRHQGKGYGRPALNAVLDKLKQAGKPIQLDVAYDNTRAQHLYEQAGFKKEHEWKSTGNWHMKKDAKLLYHGSPDDIPVLSGSATKASHGVDGKAFLTPDKILAACFIINKQKILDRLEKQLGHRIENSNFSYDVWKMSPEKRAAKDRITVGINVPGIKPFNGSATGYIYSADVPDDKLQQYNDSDMNNEVVVEGDVPYQNKEKQRVKYRVQSSV